MWHNDRKEMMNFKHGEYMVKMFSSPQWTRGGVEGKIGVLPTVQRFEAC